MPRLAAPLGLSELKCHIVVKKEIEDGDEDGIKDKETAIIELGNLLAATKQADGELPFDVHVFQVNISFCKCDFKILNISYLSLHNVVTLQNCLRWSSLLDHSWLEFPKQKPQN